MHALSFHACERYSWYQWEPKAVAPKVPDCVSCRWQFQEHVCPEFQRRLVEQLEREERM